MNISTTDAKGIFTKKLIAKYQERTPVPSFLETYFPTGPGDITDTLMVSVEVQRGTEKVAIDVVRGSDGNRNEFTKSSEKIYISPYYREYFDQNAMSAYEMAWRGDTISGNALGRMINSANNHMIELENKIRRSYEIQRSQVLEFGTLTYNYGEGMIDFKRKAGSKVDLTGSGGYWTSNNDLYIQLEASGVWLRQNGKVLSNTFDLVLGSEAYSALIGNTVFKANQNLFHMKLDTIAPPRRVAQGATYKGTLSAGPYTFNVFAYAEYYENEAGNMVNIFNPKIGVVLPEVPYFKTVYAMTPQLLNPGQSPRLGQFVASEYVDEKKRTREYHIESAGMPIPVAIDQMYTMQIVA